MDNDAQLLVGLSHDELEALAAVLLAPSAQSQLDDLLLRNAQGRLVAVELSELDHILAQVDQLSLLKARARYTLRQRAALNATSDGSGH